jgi:hypothetical protein
MQREVSGRCLSLDEVTGLGEPALFLDYGETLLYEDGVVYDLHETLAGGAGAYPPERLPAQVLEHPTGIEYGWHHLLGCVCPVCRQGRDV